MNWRIGSCFSTPRRSLRPEALAVRGDRLDYFRYADFPLLIAAASIRSLPVSRPQFSKAVCSLPSDSPVNHDWIEFFR